MVSILRAEETRVDYREVIRHSPVANEPEALEKISLFVRMSAYTYVGRIAGEVAAVYGLMTPSLLSDQCYLWMLTTDVIDEHKFVFVRHSELVIEAILERYTKIVGETSVADARAVRWLKWLGAEYAYPEGKKMIPFTITRESFRCRHG